MWGMQDICYISELGAGQPEVELVGVGSQSQAGASLRASSASWGGQAEAYLIEVLVKGSPRFSEPATKTST